MFALTKSEVISTFAKIRLKSILFWVTIINEIKTLQKHSIAKFNFLKKPFKMSEVNNDTSCKTGIRGRGFYFLIRSVVQPV